MLFISYWELNENISEKEKLEASQKIEAMQQSEETNVIRWDITPDLWGITIFEADNITDIMDGFSIYRALVPGFFKTVKVSPAMPAAEAIAHEIELLKSLGEMA
jgi:hypothetical protein